MRRPSWPRIWRKNAIGGCRQQRADTKIGGRKVRSHRVKSRATIRAAPHLPRPNTGRGNPRQEAHTARDNSCRLEKSRRLSTPRVRRTSHPSRRVRSPASGQSELVRGEFAGKGNQGAAVTRNVVMFQRNPLSVDRGNLELNKLPVGQRTEEEPRQQCTACGLRFDGSEYRAYLGSPMHPDIRLDNVMRTDKFFPQAKTCGSPFES